MNDAQLEARLEKMIVRALSREANVLNGTPHLGCVNTMGELEGMGELGSMFSKLAKKFVSGAKKVIRKVAPIAAIAVNLVPGIGQIASAAIATGIAYDQKQQEAKALAAAQAEANAQQAVLDAEATAAMEAQRVADEQAKVASDAAAAEAAKQAQAQADALTAKTLELQKQAADLAAARQKEIEKNAAELKQMEAAQAAAIAAQRSGLIQPGMSAQEAAVQIARQQMAQAGYAMNSPEAQQLVQDVVGPQMVTAGVGGVNLEKLALPLAIGAVAWVLATRKG